MLFSTAFISWDIFVVFVTVVPPTVFVSDKYKHIRFCISFILHLRSPWVCFLVNLVVVANHKDGCVYFRAGRKSDCRSHYFVIPGYSSLMIYCLFFVYVLQLTNVDVVRFPCGVLITEVRVIPPGIKAHSNLPDSRGFGWELQHRGTNTPHITKSHNTLLGVINLMWANQIISHYKTKGGLMVLFLSNQVNKSLQWP